MTFAPDAARMKQDLADLIAIRSENPPGGEKEIADLVAARLLATGFGVSLDEYRPGRFNVEARLENGDGPIFAFNTHMDTVPAGDGWTSDPFVLRAHQGRLYGRGAADDKAGIATHLGAVRVFGDDLPVNLVMFIEGEEEVGAEIGEDGAAETGEAGEAGEGDSETPAAPAG